VGVRRNSAELVAHVRLCHSRMLFVRAYPRETKEMVFDAHDRAFALFKGTCGRGIYDNMKTAVNPARLCVPQAAQRQPWARCSMTTSGVGSGRSNTWRAL
jgi:transposase